MTNKISTTKQGFTIIEVVLVLAIAGLIFLMVFVAFPALQRNQRDTQRRQDFADLAAAIIASTGDNNGNPAKGTLAASVYINSTGTDPQGNAYNISAETLPASLPTLGTGDVKVYYSAQCNASGTPVSGTAKQFAVYAKLESGQYCNTYSY